MTAVPDLAAWLREQIETDKMAAEAASSEHLCPEARSGRWQHVGIRHVRYGNGASETMHAVDVTGGPGLWYEQIWVKGDPDSAVAIHIARNNPASVIARCEAELAILDEHKPVDVPGMAWRGCATCRDRTTRWPKTHPCRTVRLLGNGYRNRPGYQEEWAP